MEHLNNWHAVASVRSTYYDTDTLPCRSPNGLGRSPKAFDGGDASPITRNPSRRANHCRAAIAIPMPVIMSFENSRRLVSKGCQGFALFFNPLCFVVEFYDSAGEYSKPGQRHKKEFSHPVPLSVYPLSYPLAASHPPTEFASRIILFDGERDNGATLLFQNSKFPLDAEHMF